MKHIYLYAKSSDSLSFHPLNNVNDFTIELPETMYLEGKWVIALTELYIQNEVTHPLYIYCDLCEQSILNGYLQPILKVIYPDCVQFSNLHYVAVKNISFKRLRIYIKGGVSGREDVLAGESYLSLHLTQHNE